MKIGVISDTHMPKQAKQLPSHLLAGLNGVDLIIHAGDWTTLDVYHQLSSIAPVKGVYGNVDPSEIKESFQSQLLLTILGKKIGVTHGHLGKKKTTPERAMDAFTSTHVDIVLFGHSHIPYHEKIGNTILFNPGSPTDKRFQPRYSYGILTIENEVTINHIFYNDKN
ncbi:metallophosphoesterase family protein [Bacillus carboniphilus]|uniref:Phosphoesterase n=1 Tax=Bacillus carboniphilus TaxID=86663 RepID=A0ABP3FRJ8_9BACI